MLEVVGIRTTKHYKLSVLGGANGSGVKLIIHIGKWMKSYRKDQERALTTQDPKTDSEVTPLNQDRKRGKDHTPHPSRLVCPVPSRELYPVIMARTPPQDPPNPQRVKDGSQIGVWGVCTSVGFDQSE
eukprot:2399749-Amphidinium_carterae.1